MVRTRRFNWSLPWRGVLIGGSVSHVCFTPAYCVAIGQAPLNLCTFLPPPVLRLD
ncbi:pentatricopeptide repeat-containing protein [Clarias magur]|uniref:Pentatricopeptide repeat-containing protein n=1 Tax=Clarias magur TaxID=1594786 RepID=A0A8J4UIT4_CLAMG|nr:pentatricopeptide repeat-containing protein [Clarias magur]